MVGRAFVVATALLACSKKEQPEGQAKTTATAPAADAATKVQYGWFRGVLQLKGEHRVAFLLHLPAPGAAEPPLIVNGEEQIKIAATWNDEGVKIQPLELQVDPYPSEITAQVKTPTTLEGTWHRYNPFWGALDIPFTAEHLQGPNAGERFAANGAAPGGALPSFDGVWKVELEKRGHAIAELHQTTDGVVTGYIRPERFGDSQNLAGNVRGDRLLLSTFDGRSGATSLIAHLTPDGHLEGDIDIADKFTEKLTGARDASYKPNHTITLKGGTKKLPLAKLDAYKGKPMIVVLFATWCPVCAEVNAAVEDLYAQYHPQGLEALGVAIDLSDDDSANQKNLDTYREKSHIPWEMIEVPGNPEEFASIPPLSSIKGFEALPVTVFLTKDHTVAAMYAGFDGISTGKAKHEMQLAEFKRQTEALLKK